MCSHIQILVWKVALLAFPYIVIVRPIGCRPYSCFFLLLLLLLLLLQSLSRSSIKHQYFHDSSVGFNISYMVGKRTSPGFIWRWQRQRQRHTQRQIQGQRQSFQEESLPVHINLVILHSKKYINKFFIVSHHFSLSLTVPHCFSPFLIVSHRFSLFLSIHKL